jgi:hypothetical protein
MQEIIICGIVDPAFDWNSVICITLSDVITTINTTNHTFMKNIAHRAIVQNSHSAQIRLDATQVLYVCAVPKRAVLSIKTALEELPLLLQPINDRVGIFLHAGGEYDELVPLAYFAEEFVTVRTLVNVVEDRVLGADYRSVGGGAEADGSIELDLYHVAGGHSTALGEGVD